MDGRMEGIYISKIEKIYIQLTSSCELGVNGGIVLHSISSGEWILSRNGLKL